LLVVALTGTVAVAEPLTLDDFYRAALKRSEVVAIQSELIVQAEERGRQAVAAMLPNINGVGTFNRYDPGVTPTTVPATPPLETRTHTSKLTVSQPVTRGFREFAILRQSRALSGAQGEDERNARALLYRDVVQNFYTVLSLESDLKNLNEEIRHNQERERDIQARVNIGRSRPSEVLNVQAAISTLRAQVEQLQGQLQVARESFAFLSGLPSDTPLVDEAGESAAPEPLANYLAGLEQRPDVRAARERVAAAREGITVAARGHLPSLELSGNYYLYRDNVYDSMWDTQLVLTVPLYAGGATESKRREAVSQRAQAELIASQVQRAAGQDIRALHESLNFDQRQVEALERATEAARKSYEAQVRDYRLGLVTNLDVLQSLTVFQQNQRALDRARYTLKADHQRLLTAAARRPTGDAPAAP
jgi:outer membrane protein